MKELLESSAHSMGWSVVRVREPPCGGFALPPAHSLHPPHDDSVLASLRSLPTPSPRAGEAWATLHARPPAGPAREEKVGSVEREDATYGSPMMGP